MVDTIEDKDVDYASGMSAFESKHFSTAIRLLSPFADQGHPEAQHRLAIMFQNGLGMARNDKLAEKWMRKSADQGFAIAQHGLGFMYLQGEGIEKNGEEAAKWFILAADQGLAGSLTTLAMMYEQGDGVEQDKEKAKALYKQAGFDI